MKRKFPHSSSRHTLKGSILILVLIVVAGLTAIAVGFTYRTRMEIKLANSYAQRTYVYHLARGGIERSIAKLSQNFPEETNPASAIVNICTLNTTANTENLFSNVKDHNPEQSLLWYAIQDEEGYLNLNKSDPATWEKFAIVNRALRAGILDWMDSDDNENPEGAETDYYEMLQPPYSSKNTNFITLRELLYIKGITPEIYRGNRVITEAIEKLSNNTKSNFEAFPWEDKTKTLGLIDIFTVYGNGQININTAPTHILAILPGLDETVAGAILTFRKGLDGIAGTEDDQPIESNDDLEKIPGLTDQQKELLGQYCCFNSQYFRVFSYAKLKTGIDCCLMATIKCVNNDIKVLYVEKIL